MLAWGKCTRWLLHAVLVLMTVPSLAQPRWAGAAGEQAEQHSQAGKGQLGRRSGGLVVMSVYHKSGMWLAPRLINVLYGAGLARAEQHVTSDFGNYQKCKRTGFCYGWRQEQGKPRMVCPTYSDCVRNGLRTASQDSTAFVVQLTNGAFVCDDMAAKFDGPLPRVALMLRDPFSLVISSFIYHAQKPTPEDWVINTFTDPCVPNRMQTATGMAYMAELLHIPHDSLLAVAALHERLFNEGGRPYYSALLKLSRTDGARLEASRYLMFMPAQRKDGVVTRKCGDGLLVMAAGAMAVNSRQLDGEVFMMGDWIGNSTTQRATMSRLLNLVCGDGDCSDSSVVQRVTDDFLSNQQRDLGQVKGGDADTLSHVTHLSHGSEERSELEHALKEDEVLGPLLEHLRCIITDGGFPGVECCFGQPNARCA